MKPLATGTSPAAGMRRPLWRRLLQLTFLVALLGAPAFLAAGRLDQPWIWISLITYLGFLCLTLLLVRDERLIAERGRAREGAKGWDRFFSAVPFLFLVIILVISGLDTGRFGWSPPIGIGLHLAGWVVLALAFGLTLWAMRSNTFFSRVVRIQVDRGHHVISAGPYTYVRHPGYLGMLSLGIGLPLLLGSIWALVPGALQVALMCVRTALEDRTLQAELPGYREYAQQVRYRLIPGIW